MRDFAQTYNAVELFIEQRYGIPVSITDVLDPNTGDFNGERIQIDYQLEVETALFVLVHLFGHTVQWNTSKTFRHLGQRRSSPTEADLALIETYERDATRYSLQLLHEAQITDMDQWVTDWWYADWQLLQHLYRTGERLNFKAYYKPDAIPALTAMEIPHFIPHRWVSRYSF